MGHTVVLWGHVLGATVLVAAGTADPGSAQDRRDPVDVSSTLNVVGQVASAEDTQSELVASLDLFADAHLGPLVIHMYVEANTTPRSQGVSTRIPFANMDAGSALGAAGRGRVQLSELRLAWPISDRTVWHAGLMDLTGFLDVSRISNDENLFFLAQPFVNNPTILFPDYVLGTALVVGVPKLRRGRVAVTVSSSHGLGDNASASYGDLVKLTEEGKGLFTAGRFRWSGDRWYGDLGGWTSSGTRAATGFEARPLPTRGFYALLGFTSTVHSLNARFGQATGPSGGESLAGLTYLGTLRSNALGIGVAKAPGLPSFDGRSIGHLEAFVRREIASAFYLTTSVQRLSGDVLTEGSVDAIWILGLRVSAAFR